jgi:UV DNA damage endonuclease
MGKMIKRLGWACKFLYKNQNEKKRILEEYEKPFNTRATTVQWLNRQNKTVAEQRLWEIMVHNIESIKKVLYYLKSLPVELRCFRIGSDILPVYTEPSWRYYWLQQHVVEYAEREFAKVGQLARELNIKLSFHPGQFCCIVSDSDDVVTRSLDELEYHATMARWMGYGKSKLDFKINVHLSGRRRAAGFDAAWHRMSPELKNCLTLENDEYQTSIEELITLKNKVGIVLDIHHHLIHSGKYIQPTDDRIKHVIESWQGVRPTMHHSQPKSEFLTQFVGYLPSFDQLLQVANKSQLRAHSDYCDHSSFNDWALSHLEWADIMVESKKKNLASIGLYNYGVNKGLINSS